MLESSGVVSGVSSEGNKRSLEEEGSSSKEGSSSSATPSSKRAKQDLQSLPTRQYLDQTVVPILLQVVPQNSFKIERAISCIFDRVSPVWRGNGHGIQ